MKTHTEEIWRDIPNYEGSYQISNIGRCKSLERSILAKRLSPKIYNMKSKIHTEHVTKSGYISYVLRIYIYSQGNDYSCCVDSKGRWVVSYSNDYPLQHGSGNKHTFSESNFLDATDKIKVRDRELRKHFNMPKNKICNRKSRNKK